MRNNTRRILSLLLAALIFCAAALPVFAEETAQSIQSAEAAAMQLVKTEGTVAVTNSTGRGLTTRNDMRLYNGYHVSTQAASYAWINLDNAKLTKLDQVSEAELRKSGKVLELMLNSGSLYFNVTSPLSADETLNIRTSTMVVGIRGTTGWVKVTDRWSAEIYVLEGKVECSVADPVTGQVKTGTIQSGQKATAVVYPQDQVGDKCDIFLGQYQAEEIDGFALVELAQDPALCQEIMEASGIDVLGSLGADLRQPGQQAALETALAAAQERLGQDQQTMQSTLDHIAGQVAQQESGVSTGTVWTREESPSSSQASSAPPAASSVPEVPASGTGSSSDRDTGYSGGSSSGGSSSGGSSSGVGSSSSGGSSSSSSDTGSVRTLTMPVTAAQVQSALGESGVTEVIVKPGSTNGDRLEVDIAMTVPGGKTLTISKGVGVVVQSGKSLTVKGTMTGPSLENNGTVTVESSNSLEMASITNNGSFTNTASGRVRTDTLVSKGTLNNAGAIDGPVKMESGSFVMTGGTVTAPSNKVAVTVNGGGFTLRGGTVDSEVFVEDGGRFTMEGGTLRGDDKSALVLASGSDFEMNGGEITSASKNETISIALDKTGVRFNKGTVTNTGSGFAVTINVPYSPDNAGFSGTVFRAGKAEIIKVYYESDDFTLTSWTPPGYIVTETKQSDGYYHMEPGENEEPGGDEGPGKSVFEINDSDEFLQSLNTLQSGNTIILTGDISPVLSSDAFITAGTLNDPVILDLNGHNLNLISERDEPLYLSRFRITGTLLIQDSADGSDGTLSTTAEIVVQDSGHLILDSGKIEAPTNFLGFYLEYSALTVNGGEINLSGGISMYQSALAIHGGTTEVQNIGLTGSTITMDKGTVNLLGSGLYMGEDGTPENGTEAIRSTFTMTGGTFYGTIDIVNSTFSISGGEILGDEENYMTNLFLIGEGAIFEMTGGEISASCSVVFQADMECEQILLSKGTITHNYYRDDTLGGEKGSMFYIWSEDRENIPNLSIHDTAILSRSGRFFINARYDMENPYYPEGYTSTDEPAADGYFHLTKTTP